MERIMDNSNSILFLSGSISILLSEMERYLALHERVKSELDHILDALDNLSNNLLSHSVVRPFVLKRMIEHVKQQLAEKYINYELVITEVPDYYNIPVSSFDYVDINSEMVDETENENAYTQIIPNTEMVAMNRDTYINPSFAFYIYICNFYLSNGRFIESPPTVCTQWCFKSIYLCILLGVTLVVQDEQAKE